VALISLHRSQAINSHSSTPSQSISSSSSLADGLEIAQENGEIGEENGAAQIEHKKKKKVKSPKKQHKKQVKSPIKRPKEKKPLQRNLSSLSATKAPPQVTLKAVTKRVIPPNTEKKVP
jgi:hypothetical protein